MKIYRNHYQNEEGGSDGYTFHSSKKDAIKRGTRSNLVRKPFDVAYLLEIKPGKKNLIKFLNVWAGHPDNG